MEGYGKYGRRKFAFVLLALAMVVIVGFVVMILWNWLMPVLFGLPTITYWQALGLLVLSKILFGGFKKPGGGPGSSWHWRRRFMKKWENMSEEDRQKMRDKFKSSCC